MPAIDQCHYQIVRALEKEKFRVQPKPFYLKKAGRRFFADIEAEHLDEQNRQRIIVVEAKCFFDSSSELDELYGAIGQYLVYRNLLNEKYPDRQLYLAIPVHAYEGIFTEIGLAVATEVGINLIVVNLAKEEIVQWIP